MVEPVPVVIGHRGAAAVAPENTLAAIRAGLDAGATWIEFDVQLTADGRPVLLHDRTLERTTDGRGRLVRRSLGEVRALDAGSWFDERFRGERVPELHEAIGILRGRAVAVVELKTDDSADFALRDAVLEEIARRGDPAAVVLTSKEWDLLRGVRSRAPGLAIALTVGSTDRRDAVAAAVELGASALHPNRSRLARSMVARARDAGLAVRPYTVNTASELRQVLRFDVDAVFTDDPATILRLLAGNVRS